MQSRVGKSRQRRTLRVKMTKQVIASTMELDAVSERGSDGLVDSPLAAMKRTSFCYTYLLASLTSACSPFAVHYVRGVTSVWTNPLKLTRGGDVTMHISNPTQMHSSYCRRWPLQLSGESWTRDKSVMSSTLVPLKTLRVEELMRIKSVVARNLSVDMV
ncbi:hypothetical protein TNCV_3252711 [Trichonephila clavipes]|nr:hypothetical protein TNCV_3252711 [Trichonephila clavipes]